MNGFKPERRSCCQGVKYKEKMISFGGINDESYFNDVLEYDPFTNKWKTIHQGTVGEQKQQKKNKEIVPEPRSGHSLTLVENTLYLIGGTSDDVCESYSFDLITKKWKILSTFYKKIYFHSTTLAEGDLYIFGGDTYEGFENKLSKFQLSDKNKNQNESKNKNKNKNNNNNHQNKKEKENKNNKEKEPRLIELKTFGDVPKPTTRHSSFYWGGYLYIFGGTKSLEFTQNQDSVNENNCLYRIDLKTLIWETVETTGDKPNPRRSFVYEIRDDKFYIFGGVNSSFKYYNDLYMLDLRTCKWHFIETTGNPPCKRGTTVSAIIRGKLYIAFGSYGKTPDWVDLSDCYSLQLPHLVSDDLSMLFSSGKCADLKICDIPIHSSLVQTRVGGKIFNKLLQISKSHKYKKNKSLISNKMNTLLFWVYTDYHQELAKLVADEFNLQIDFNNHSLKKDLIALYNNQESMDFTIIISDEEVDVDENENVNVNEKESENKKLEDFETLKVHKWILYARSNLYRSLFSTISNISQVKDYSHKSTDSLSKLIEFFYHDKILLTADDNLEVLLEELTDARSANKKNNNTNHLKKSFQFWINKQQNKSSNVSKNINNRSGNFSVVKIATDRKTSEKWAIKIISKKDMGNNLLTLQNEINILTQVNHPNIISLREIFETKDKVYLVMEYCDGGDLFDDLLEEEFYDEEKAARIVFKILSVLKYLHSIEIAHRDLKPENLLLSGENNEIKISDFGLSKIYSKNIMLQTQCGKNFFFFFFFNIVLLISVILLISRTAVLFFFRLIFIFSNSLFFNP
ncbi:hypothetical protein M0813_16908 [Anaeramoeba flamelloides]|uniref:Uncharacterized protein n=1 Tax=Anaeramoeba flamelloides TaxID=1746091 RepID=A0ABQ8YY05_9EUKA|nr:hypothetical protein M0813_16908 [Anaeramoeba flamelloides]